MTHPLALLLALAVWAGPGQAQGIHKWVDEQGRTHYTDRPPDKGKARELPCPPPLTEQQLKAGREAAEQARRTLESGGAAAGANLPRPGTPPGPLPANEVSEYMRTVATGVDCDWRDRDRPVFRLSIAVHVRADVPEGALLEAEFQNPAEPSRPLRASATVRSTRGYPQVRLDQVLLVSSEVQDIRCGRYPVEVRLYRDGRWRELIGTHRQDILSRFDSRAWISAADWAERLLRDGYVCP